MFLQFLNVFQTELTVKFVLLNILRGLCMFSVLLLAVVVHRKKTDDMYKDTDDIRENIINYEDEGGGEGDMTGYDLNVLRLMYDDPLNEKQMPNNTHLIQRPGERRQANSLHLFVRIIIVIYLGLRIMVRNLYLSKDFGS